MASITFRALIFAIEGFLPGLLGHQVSLMFGVLSLLNLGPQPQPTKMSAAVDKLQLFLTRRAIDDPDGTINRTKALTARFTHEQLQQTFDGLESIPVDITFSSSVRNSSTFGKPQSHLLPQTAYIAPQHISSAIVPSAFPDILSTVWLSDGPGRIAEFHQSDRRKPRMTFGYTLYNVMASLLSDLGS